MKTLPENFLGLVDRQIVYILGCMCAVLIFFQANLVFDKFKLNMNCADILGICGATIAILNIYQGKYFKFRLKYVNLFLLASSLAFLIAFFVGCLNVGFTSFAFVNKFLGYYVLLGYAALGVIFVNAAADQGQQTVIRLMTSTVLIILFVKLALNALYFLNRSFVVNTILSGYANNRNAFALQLMCVAFMNLCLPKKSLWLISFLFTGVIFTYSRSAMTTMVLLLLLCNLFKIINLKELLLIITYTLLLVLAVFVIEQACIYFNTNIGSASDGNGIIGMFDLDNFSNANSNNQRKYSLFEAFQLWKQQPWFGIGLGSFAHHELLKNNGYLVIHNTLAWIITEFGIIGSTIFIGYAMVILRHLYCVFIKSRQQVTMEDQILLCLFFVFILMSGAHEIFYQRIFWFIGGIILVQKAKFSEISGLDLHKNLEGVKL